jgi:hypothetical protein
MTGAIGRYAPPQNSSHGYPYTIPVQLEQDVREVGEDVTVLDMPVFENRGLVLVNAE